MLLYYPSSKNKGQDEELPITAAASIGHKDMVSYLFEVTNFDLLQQQERLNLLHITIQSEMYDVALKENWVHSAAKAGNLGFLLVVTRDYPVLMWTNDDKRHTILHVAVLYREEKVFSLIHQIGGMKNIFLVDFDNDGNNILHLAGKLGEPIFSKQKSSGQMEALKNKLVQSVPPNADNNNVVFVESLQQLFQEIEIIRHITETQSLKEVEKLVPLSFHKDGKTPRELFTEEHKALLKDGEKWMKDTANSCMIAATLIATMVFAA
ncbi:hypothetical protein MTR67_008692 [Solanum verrucosum]|uniref:Ankyrin repeat-containing protein n=1 Tax=Solanum verrucosum TaxID=315347 RepID=A0AAF0TCP2_SOLVR|nr:hypothetical protein MTR67_008692 [Solanum verrucosum]